MDNQNEIQESKSISIMDILILVKKYWPLLLTAIVICTVAGFFAGKFMDKPKYTATADIMVTYVDNSNSVAGDRNALLYGLELCGTVRDFAKTTSVYNNMSLCENEYVEKNYMRGMSITSEDENTTVIHVSYSTYSGKEYAIETVNQIVNSIVEVSNSVDENQKPKFKALYGNIAPFDPTVSAGVSTNGKIYIVGGFAIGCLISFLFIFLKHILDDTIKGRRDLEAVTGFKAIAFIEDLVSKN